jgi:antitoxin VapB
MVEGILPFYHRADMALNIKNREAHRMAQALADATGTSLTEAVTEALRARLAEIASRPVRDLMDAEIEEIQAFVAALPDRDVRTEDEILGYDRFGLPS